MQLVENKVGRFNLMQLEARAGVLFDVYMLPRLVNDSFFYIVEV